MTLSKFDFWSPLGPPKSKKIETTGPRALQKSPKIFKTIQKGRFWSAFGTRLFFDVADLKVDSYFSCASEGVLDAFGLALEGFGTFLGVADLKVDSYSSCALRT